MQDTATKLNYIVLFAAISLGQSNLGEDSMAPAWRLFQKGHWPPDPQPTTQVDSVGRGFDQATIRR